MNRYSYIISDSGVSVIDTQDGRSVKIQASSYGPEAVEKAKEAIRVGDFEQVFSMTVRGVVENVAKTTAEDGLSVSIKGGEVYYSYAGREEVLHNALCDRMIAMVQQGFDVKPLMRFLDNLMKNPSKTSVDELYLFLERTNLPITDDGHFIAYKIVRDNYASHADASFMNEVGTVVEMRRNDVDEDRNRTCSYGLHFCSKDYLGSYGNVNGDTDRLLLLKINPADVVTIPSDYNNAKGRACKYLIWKDITEDNWRAKYISRDYNDSPVEYMDFEDMTEDDEDEELSLSKDEILDAIDEELDDMEESCPACGSTEFYKKGTEKRFGDLYERRKCKNCGQNYYIET